MKGNTCVCLDKRALFLSHQRTILHHGRTVDNSKDIIMIVSFKDVKAVFYGMFNSIMNMMIQMVKRLPVIHNTLIKVYTPGKGSPMFFSPAILQESCAGCRGHVRGMADRHCKAHHLHCWSTVRWGSHESLWHMCMSCFKFHSSLL